jgi:hypothetical protein
MGIYLEELQVLKKEPQSISEIKREMICPDCGDNLMNGGNCFFCYCGWSSCG